VLGRRQDFVVLRIDNVVEAKGGAVMLSIILKSFNLRPIGIKDR
jgi:hypothetical protein